MNEQPPPKPHDFQATNENLSRAALTTLIALLLASIVAFVRQNNEITISQLGIAITVRQIDSILILGALLAEITAFDFYSNIVVKVREEWESDFFSFAGMIYMLFLNILLFVPELFSARVLLIAGLMGLITIKNGLLSKRLGETSLGKRLAIWHNNTKWGFFSALGAGLVFLLMFNEKTSTYLLSFFVAGDNISLKKSYSTWIPACFYIVFLFTSLRALVRNKVYFYSDAYKSEINTSTSPQKAPGG